jgi:hypothetical protein
VFQQIKWVPTEELLNLDFIDGDLPLVQRLASSDRETSQ